MLKVGIFIAHKNSGLHEGHRAVIEFGKQFGDVTVNCIENMAQRNKYLQAGLGTEKYKVDLNELESDCNELQIGLKRPSYISISDEERLAHYNRARNFIESYRKYLISERYIQMAMCAIMEAKIGGDGGSDIVVAGPEVLSFFFKIIAPIMEFAERKIYPVIVKNQYGIKESTSWNDISFDISEIKKVIDDAKDKYKVGNNEDLVKELNFSYKNKIWKVNEILVYEGGFVDGRIEATAFSFPTESGGIGIIEEVEYYGPK